MTRDTTELASWMLITSAIIVIMVNDNVLFCSTFVASRCLNTF